MQEANLLVKMAKALMAGEKVHRDAFIYLEPKEPKDTFAQCASCAMWTGKTCTILGPDVPVDDDDSCSFYVHGPKAQPGTEKALVTPEEAGFVDRQVRCENCVSFNAGTCELFKALNKALPEQFDLEEKVNPKGCCNAQREK